LSYSLPTGLQDSKRLDIQHRFLMEISVDHLERAGFKKGQVVYDIGCGNGAMTEYLAETVDPKGHVYACDSNSEQISEAKKRIAEAGLNNVTFLQYDICDSEVWKDVQLADIIYARFLLMHLKRPEQAIKTMGTLLKPEGALASMEPIRREMYFQPAVPLLNSVMEIKLAFGRELGVDYEIGLHLPDLYKKSGFEVSTVEISQRDFSEGFEGIVAWCSKAVEAGFITQEQFEQWKIEIQKQKSKGTKFFTAKLMTVVARKI
jgi:SAM-dependent methyltransferase